MSLEKDKSILIDNLPYQLTSKDELYNRMFQYLFNKGILKSLSDKGYSQASRGEDFICTYTELFYYQSLVQYLIIFQEEVSKTCLSASQINSLKDDFGFSCIRKTMYCKYNSTKILDDLLKIALGEDGVDFMVLDCSGDYLGPELSGLDHWSSEYAGIFTLDSDLAEVTYTPPSEFLNKDYRLSFTILEGTGSLIVSYDDGGVPTQTTYSSPGTYMIEFSPLGNQEIAFTNDNLLNDPKFVITDISIREVITSSGDNCSECQSQFIIQ